MVTSCLGLERALVGSTVVVHDLIAKGDKGEQSNTVIRLWMSAIEER